MSTESPTPQQAAVAIAKQPRAIKDLIKSTDFENAVKAALPKHLTVERFMRVALNATMRKPELLDCTKESFFLCMLELSALGIEPDGRRAHLIPFKNSKLCGICGHPKDQHQQRTCRIPGCRSTDCGFVPAALECTLIIDYKGIAELVRRSGDVSYMHCDAVYSNDTFDFKFGSGAMLSHKPKFDGADRGVLLGFYSFVKLNDGNEDFIVVSKSDTDKIRSRSKAKDSGPWVTDYDEMGKKTAFRRHSKWLPLSSEVADSIAKGDDGMDIEGAFTAVEGSVSAVDFDRLEKQMAEQATEALGEPTPAIEPTRETTKPAVVPMPSQNPSNGRWATKEAMIADFDKVRAALGDDDYFDICGRAGIGSEDDMQLANPVTGKAYAELQAESEFRSKPKVNSTATSQPELNLRPRRNR